MIVYWTTELYMQHLGGVKAKFYGTWSIGCILGYLAGM
jgi:hypothetical protein